MGLLTIVQELAPYLDIVYFDQYIVIILPSLAQWVMTCNNKTCIIRQNMETIWNHSQYVTRTPLAFHVNPKETMTPHRSLCFSFHFLSSALSFLFEAQALGLDALVDQLELRRINLSAGISGDVSAIYLAIICLFVCLSIDLSMYICWVLLCLQSFIVFLTLIYLRIIDKNTRFSKFE